MPSSFTNLGTYSFPNNGTNGYELWKSDRRTPAPSWSRILIRAAVDPPNLTNVAGTLFSAGDAANGAGFGKATERPPHGAGQGYSEVAMVLKSINPSQTSTYAVL
jgi:hypothetical protein